MLTPTPLGCTSATPEIVIVRYILTVQSLGDWSLCKTVCEDVSRDKGTRRVHFTVRLLDGVAGWRKEITGDEV